MTELGDQPGLLSELRRTVQLLVRGGVEINAIMKGQVVALCVGRTYLLTFFQFPRT